MKMESLVESISLNDNKHDDSITAEKLAWDAPACTQLDLSLVTYDGLIPSFDLPLVSLVS